MGWTVETLLKFVIITIMGGAVILTVLHWLGSSTT